MLKRNYSPIENNKVDSTLTASVWLKRHLTYKLVQAMEVGRIYQNYKGASSNLAKSGIYPTCTFKSIHVK